MYLAGEKVGFNIEDDRDCAEFRVIGETKDEGILTPESRKRLVEELATQAISAIHNNDPVLSQEVVRDVVAAIIGEEDEKNAYKRELVERAKELGLIEELPTS